jgi:pimeloyl-ACP methyl ester carboxylesterase
MHHPQGSPTLLSTRAMLAPWISTEKSTATYDEIERKLAAAPPISVPTITMEGDANGAPHPPPESYRAKFTGQYEHRTIQGGIGHNLPQEAPQAFAEAVIDIA